MAKYTKIEDMVTEAQNLCDETADNKTWVDWFNNALDDLAPVMLLDRLTTIEADAETGEFTLPEDLLSIIYVADDAEHTYRRLKPNDFASVGYKVISDSLSLQGVELPRVNVYYKRYPAYFSTANTAAIDLPARYSRAVIFYACSQCMLSEDEVDRYTYFVQQYNAARESIKAEANRKRQGVSGQWEVFR